MVHGPEQIEHRLTRVDHLASNDKPQKTLSLVRKVDTLSVQERERGATHRRMVLTLEHASDFLGARGLLKTHCGQHPRDSDPEDLGGMGVRSAGLWETTLRP